MSEDQHSLEEIRFADVAPAIELICWIVAALAPLLRLVNGPAVSNDQWWIQVTLFSSALAGAVGLRLYHIKGPPRKSGNASKDARQDGVA